jgi:hypothetical protein
LTAAANQSSNRDPVASYAEGEVTSAIQGLRDKGLVRVVLAQGNRAPKYRHVLDETWALDEQHRAVLALLLLRGPQTVGELRGRSDRLAVFDGLEAVEEVLGLLARRDEPLVVRLERQPGQKEARWAQVLGRATSSPPPARVAEVLGRAPRNDPGESTVEDSTVAPAPDPAPAEPEPDLALEVAELRTELARVRAELDQLRAVIADLLD